MEKIRSPLLKEEYYFTRHTSGLAIFIFPKRNLKKKMATLVTHYGSIDNSFRAPGHCDLTNVPAGIAHYLEHLMFKKPDGDIMNEFGRWGAVFNALTGHTATQYFFIAHKHFNENLTTLIKLAWLPHFPKANVEHERPIIEQELRMYQDIPELRLLQNLFKNLYHSHPVRFDIGGSLESIKEISAEMIIACHRTFYHPANMAMVIVGDLDHKSVLAKATELVDQAVSDWEITPAKMSGPLTIERHFDNEPKQPRQHYECIEMPVARPLLAIGYKEPHTGLKPTAVITQALLTELTLELILGKPTKLYQQLYTEGIINNSFSGGYTNHETFGLTSIGGETNQPEKLIDRIKTGIKQAKKAGFKKRDLLRLKRKHLGHFIRMFDSPDAIASILFNSYFSHVNPFDFPRYLKKVTIKEMQDRLNEHLDEKYISISLVKPLPTTKA